MPTLRQETELAASLVERALALAHSGRGEVRFKLGRDVVTDADVAVEDFIRAALEQEFGFPVVGEERGGEAPSDGPYWLLDPICGTRNFASDTPLFAVNLALVEAGEIAIGVVGDGSNGEVSVAERGGGAWRIGAAPTRLLADGSSRTVDFGAWPARGAGRDRAARALAAAVTADEWDVRCFGSCLAAAMVATGRLAGCALFDVPDSPVHTAAPSLLAMEAGALVTTLEGEPWSMGAPTELLCADAATQESVLRVLRSV